MATSRHSTSARRSATTRSTPRPAERREAHAGVPRMGAPFALTRRQLLQSAARRSDSASVRLPSRDAWSWGVVTALIGLSLRSGATWARWAAIVVGSLSFIEQLGFLGSTPY